MTKIEPAKAAQLGHVIVGHYVSLLSFRNDSLKRELLQAGVVPEPARKALIDAARTTELIIKRMMGAR